MLPAASPTVVINVKTLLIKTIVKKTEQTPPHHPLMYSPLSPLLMRILQVTPYTEDTSLPHMQPCFRQITCRFGTCVWAKQLGCLLFMSVITGDKTWCIQAFSPHGKWAMHRDGSSG